MANVTVYADPGVVVDVIAGTPPVDQSAQVAALTAKLDQLKALAQQRKTDDAASVDGQAELDIIG